MCQMSLELYQANPSISLYLSAHQSQCQCIHMRCVCACNQAVYKHSSVHFMFINYRKIKMKTQNKVKTIMVIVGRASRFVLPCTTQAHTHTSRKYNLKNINKWARNWLKLVEASLQTCHLKCPFVMQFHSTEMQKKNINWLTKPKQNFLSSMRPILSFFHLRFASYFLDWFHQNLVLVCSLG